MDAALLVAPRSPWSDSCEPDSEIEQDKRKPLEIRMIVRFGVQGSGGLLPRMMRASVRPRLLAVVEASRKLPAGSAYG